MVTPVGLARLQGKPGFHSLVYMRRLLQLCTVSAVVASMFW